MPFFTAHRLVSALTMLYVCNEGGHVWLYPDRALRYAGISTLTRLQTPHAVASHLSNVLLYLNIIWDIPAGFMIDSLRLRSNAKQMLTHHVVVVILAYLSLAPSFQYYVPCFMGLLEVSSVPLALMDLCHPRNAVWAEYAKQNRLVGAANGVARVVFAFAYMVSRALYFPYVVATGLVDTSEHRANFHLHERCIDQSSDIPR